MFIEIKGNSGVYIGDSFSHTEIVESFFINLDLTLEVRFSKTTEFDKIKDIEKDTISFYFVGEEPIYNFTFNKQGMGEYHRLKRIIESQILK